MTLFLALVFGAACSDDNGDEAGDGETGDGDGDGDGDVDLCAAQANSDDQIAETQVDTPYPTAAGGTLVDGTWDLVRFEVYSPATADANTRAGRVIISGDTMISIRSNNGEPAEILGSTFVVNGTELEFTLVCPSTGSLTLPFTITDTELWLFDPSEPNVQVYAKQ